MYDTVSITMSRFTKCTRDLEKFHCVANNDTFIILALFNSLGEVTFKKRS